MQTNGGRVFSLSPLHCADVFNIFSIKFHRPFPGQPSEHPRVVCFSRSAPAFAALQGPARRQNIDPAHPEKFGYPLPRLQTTSCRTAASNRLGNPSPLGQKRNPARAAPHRFPAGVLLNRDLLYIPLLRLRRQFRSIENYGSCPALSAVEKYTRSSARSFVPNGFRPEQFNKPSAVL